MNKKDPIYTDGIDVNGTNYIAIANDDCIGCVAASSAILCNAFDSCSDFNGVSVSWFPRGKQVTPDEKENLGEKLNTAWKQYIQNPSMLTGITLDRIIQKVRKELA